MAGFAPFGRDDQPLLDVKIVGGKRLEIVVDRYGKPLNKDNKPKGSESRFSRSLSEERNIQNCNSSQSPSVPPWIRGVTPPNKMLKPLEVSPVSTAATSRKNSRSGSRSSEMSAGSSMILPPITSQRIPDPHCNNDSNSLLQELKIQLYGFDTAKFKDAYLHFTGLDSTVSGFVDAGQVKQVFSKCRIPIDGKYLNALLSKFMAARRPNWINYEQMLKYVNGVVRNEERIEGRVPTLDFSSNNSPDEDISLKPNQLSPHSVNDGSTTGRQSTMLVKHAFQDRQDAHLLVEMERLLKQVNNINELIWSLKQTLNDSDQNNNTMMNTQKLKSICLRHHVPFNGSLLDRILDRFDPRGSGKVDRTDFMTFVERAMPLSSAGSPESSHSQSLHSVVETPPTRPSWETRQPLHALSKRQQVIPRAAALEQEEMYNEQKRLLDQHLQDQSQQLSQVLDKHQRGLDKRQKALQTDHIAQYGHLSRDVDESRVPQPPEHDVAQEQQELEERQRKLLQQQFELTEQKRKINQEQKELEKYIRDGDGATSTENMEENHVKSFLRLARALFMYDGSGSGFLEDDAIRRLVTNYNLVYRLDFSSDVIDDAIDTSSTGDGMVSVDRLLDELKKHL